MTYFVLWYLVFALLGALSFPLAYYLLPALSDRGYAFARILGLLVWGYLFWMLGSLGVLRNDLSGQLISLLLVAGLSAVGLSRIGLPRLRAWWRESRGVVLAVELLFLAAFAGWSLVRAMNPDITATEKPMELAFLNAILRSPQFPPHDPWLSGYAISYYYFGYVMVAMLSALTATPAGIAFNLGVSVIFALAAVGAYGVLYTLLSKTIDAERRGKASAALAALLGPLFVLLVSNLEGFLDVLHTRGLFWRQSPDGAMVSRFWAWLDLKDLVNPPPQTAAQLPFSFETWLQALEPDRFLWWWRASRVVNDVSFTGSQQEVIDEFPFFSFLLSDLHPHVLAIPFVLLAIALALNHFLGSNSGELQVGPLAIRLGWAEFFLAALTLGALAFLNTWDFPIYVALFSGAYALGGVRERGWSWERLWDFLGLGLALGLVGAALYFPFYIGFSSQAGGILPNVINPTRGAHLWVMFGTLFVPIFLYFIFRHFQRAGDLRRGLAWGFGITFGLWLGSLLVTLMVGLFPSRAVQALQSFGAPNGGALLAEAFARRFGGMGGWLTLALLLSLIFSLLIASTHAHWEEKQGEGIRAGESGPRLFILLLALTGTLLVLGPEFFYLQDLFGTRMNTIFKFYYQAWILLGLAAAYGTVVVLREWRGWGGRAAATGVVLVILMGLVYPALSLQTKTRGAQARGLTLDGTAHSYYLDADEKAAVQWLQSAPLGTLLEAVDGSYTSGGRFAAHTGHPNVLGWVFHQGQWRGGYDEVGSRQSDVETIFRTNNWPEARDLLEEYGVDYLIVGPLERQKYAVNEAKFRRNLPVLFERGGVVIYGVGSGG